MFIIQEQIFAIILSNYISFQLNLNFKPCTKYPS